jgi:hypothetical protein
VAPSCLGARRLWPRPPPAPRGEWATAAVSAPCHPRAMAALPAPCRPSSSNQPWSRSTVRRRPPSASGSRRNWPLRPPSTRGCGGIRGDTPGRRRNRFVGSRSPVASPAQLPRGPTSFGHRTATIVPVLRLGYCFPAVFPLPSDPIIALCTVNKGSGARAEMIHVFTQVDQGFSLLYRTTNHVSIISFSRHAHRQTRSGGSSASRGIGLITRNHRTSRTL